MKLGAALLVGAALTGCVPNPRNEMPTIVETAMRELARSTPGGLPCVDRTIEPWWRDVELRHGKLTAPPGFEKLYDEGVFHGGGGIKGAMMGGVPVGSGVCWYLRGPLIDGDRAMIEAHFPPIGRNVWMQRRSGIWRVVTITTTSYSE